MVLHGCEWERHVRMFRVVARTIPAGASMGRLDPRAAPWEGAGPDPTEARAVGGR